MQFCLTDIFGICKKMLKTVAIFILFRIIEQFVLISSIKLYDNMI